MKMNSKFAKARKYIVIAIFLVIAGLSVLLSKNVAINYNISDYLDESTETKISLGIIEDEFGVTGDIQVMIEDVSVEDAKDVLETLKDIDNVLSVSFNEYDEGYYKDNSALFVVVVDGDEYSETANNVLADIKDALDDKFDGKINYGGAVMEKANLRESIEGEIPFVLAIAVCFVIVIMLLTSASWIEPIILLFASGVAVLINMGTNAIFGEISYITNAVAAILQLALSIDYSIVLLHSYRKLKETGADNGKAMKCSIKEIVKPISASALTTIAGLLALLFMSMKIGFDIGIVLMKGIAISAIVSLTFLPAVLLVFDTPLNKTKKKELVLKGKSFGDMAFKACKVILPIALVIIIAGSVLQFSNTYTFTDSDKFNTVISDAFGRNNTVVVVYPNGDDSYDKEIDLVEKLNDYKTDDGRHVLKNHTAYSNTVRELYDVEKASRKLGIPEKDVELLFTMYHLYADSSKVTITPADFIQYAEGQLTDSEDVQEFASEEMTSTIRTMLMISRMMNGEYTADEFYGLTQSGIMEGAGLSQFAIRQLYGLYLYDTITDSTVDLEAMLDFMIGAMGNAELASMVDANTAASLVTLSQGIKQFNSQMEAPLTMEQFRMYMYQNYGMAMDAAVVAQIYGGYYQMQGQPMQDGIPFLKLMTFLASQGQISDPTAAATISSYNALYSTINAKYAYSQFLPVLVEVATSLSGAAPDVSVTDAAVQQMYIMYFYTQGMMPATAVQGRELIGFVKSAAETDPIIKGYVSEDGIAKLSDICTVDAFMSDTAAYDFEMMAAKLSETKENIQSIAVEGTLDSDMISGLYIKYAADSEIDLTGAVEAKDLLAFVIDNMDSHALLKTKISDDNRAGVTEAKEAMDNATELFVGDSYSRMLLSIDLESESAEASAFVAYLLDSVKDTFGEDGHAAGEMVSTYDLQNTFDKDNIFIAIFTIISIFVIVMVVFRSLSLPVVLVTVIQGAVWIAMSTSLLTGPMFFMSYIVSTCILMGATIDYGILMSTSYVESRGTYDRKESLYRALEAAMPTVFTSGVILTICGFVIGFISSQNAISTVGILLGKGTLVSVLMITLVLPSVLYLLDGFILKLTLRKKSK